MQANPFKPTAGKTPPAIIGREEVIEEFIEGLENGAGAPSRLMRISGVRGTGKTVLLGEVGKLASDQGWLLIKEVATKGLCQRILNELLPAYRVDSAEISPALMGASLGKVKLEHVGPTLHEALSKAIQENGHGLIITLDEVQDAAMDEVRILSIAIQQLIGDDLDIAFIFAGLPSMITDVINGKTLTFLRRAVPFELKAVELDDVADSLAVTIRQTGMEISDSVAALLARETQGYPFLIQLVGYQAWQGAKRRSSSVIDEEIAEKGAAAARVRFGAAVIEPALQRVSPAGMRYLLAMASEGDEEIASSGVLERLGKSASQVSVIRSRLLKDSLIEAPGYGRLRFAIPYMADYLNQHRAELETCLQ